MSSPRRRRAGMPGATVVIVTPIAVAALLASCGATDLPSPRRTVTVTVDAPAPSGSRTAAPTTSPTPTAARPSTTSATSIPTKLAAGRQRGAPTSFAEAKSRINAAPSAAGVTDRFQTPSGNITCTRRIASGTTACEVGKGRITPPLPSICPAGGPKDIGRIELRGSGAVPVCNSDTIRTGSEPKLAYGSRTVPSGATACLSETFGVTCVDASSGHGFFLARDTFVTF